MQLRHHPWLSFRGIRTWPPVWAWRDGIPKYAPGPLGELGTLKEVRFDPNLHPRRLFLTTEYQGSEYIGCLLFDDPHSCAQVVKLLWQDLGRRLTTIGSLEIPSDIQPGENFRRMPDSQTWHFSSDCSHWPNENFEQRTTPLIRLPFKFVAVYSLPVYNC
jgi:hypothetical protein